MAWMGSLALLAGMLTFRGFLLTGILARASLRACLARQAPGTTRAAFTVRLWRAADRAARRRHVCFHSRSRLQSVLAVYHDLIPFGNAAGNQRNIALRQIHFDGL